MSRLLYFDCFSGISGDMVLGALIDAGLPFDDLKRALGSLAMSGYDVSTARVLRAGVSATKFNVRETAGRQHEHAGGDDHQHTHDHGGHHHHSHDHGDDHDHDHGHHSHD